MNIYKIVLSIVSVILSITVIVLYFSQSNKIRMEQLNPGDHIYTWRNGYSYSHHGIYVGDGKVIHLTRAPGLIISKPSGEDRVVCCDIEEFLSGGDLNVYHYGVNRAHFLIKRGGTSTRFSSDPPKDVVDRAYKLLQKGFGDYNLFHSNCEDFAIYCKTELLTVDKSKPGRSGQIKFLYAIFLAFTLTPYQFLPSCFISLALVIYGLYGGFFILELDRGVEKVPVEIFDSSYHRGVRMENGRPRWDFPIGEVMALSVWLFRYYDVPMRIGYRIRSVVFQESFDDLLRNHPMIRILGGSVALILWLLVHLRFFGSKDAIYLFSQVGIICGVSWLVGYDHPRGFKQLQYYITLSAIVLGLWYWTQESRILLRKRFEDLYGFLYSFVCDHSGRLNLLEYTSQTALVLGVWYWTPESIIQIWIRLLLLNVFLFKFVLDHLTNHRSKLSWIFAACLVIQSATLFLGLDYRYYIFSITKSIFSIIGVSI